MYYNRNVKKKSSKNSYVVIAKKLARFWQNDVIFVNKNIENNNFFKKIFMP